MNQLARNNQVQAARQRLAMRNPGGGVPGGGPGNVAGCPQPLNQGGWGVPPQDQSWVPQAYFEGIPEKAPALPAAAFAPPGSIIRQHLAPCSAIIQTQAEAVTAEMAPRSGKKLYAAGVKSCNECFQVLMESMEVSSVEFDLLPCGEVDVGIWNTDDCFCAFDIGCIDRNTPLVITFSAFGTPSVFPFLNFNVIGTVDAYWGICSDGPYPWQGMPPWQPYPGQQPPGGGGGGGGFPQVGPVGMPGGGGGY